MKTLAQNLRRGWARWETFWLRSAPPHGIALFRIIFGVYLLLFFLLRLPHVPILFSSAGLALGDDRFLPRLLLPLLGPPPPTIAWIIFALLLLSLWTFTIGAWTRMSALVAFLLFVYETHVAFHQGMTSYLRLFLFFLFLFTFSDAGKAFSLDMRRKYGSFFAWEPGSVLTQRLIALQITATYLGVSFQKIWLPDWQGGEVLLFSFQSMWATPLAWWLVRQDVPLWIYDTMVFAVKSFEITLPFGLWVPKLRWWFFVGGFLFHAGITLFLSAIWWFFAMPAAYFLFFEPEEIFRMLRKWSHGRIAGAYVLRHSSACSA